MSQYLLLPILGLVEGLTEFLPVSSTGHLILARQLLDAASSNALAVDAVLQVGAIAAVLVYFRADLWRMLSLFIPGSGAGAGERKLASAIVVGTVPALLVGLYLEPIMETAFRNVHLVAYALVAGSVIFIVAERLAARGNGRPLESIGISQGFLIGLYQCLALVPGMSRSGMTISGGLALGLSREAAARFGFLLSVPIIVGSGLKKLLELWQTGALDSLEAPLLLGVLAAFISGLAAIHVLLLFVRSQPLYVFAAYRIIIAAVILIIVA